MFVFLDELLAVIGGSSRETSGNARPKKRPNLPVTTPGSVSVTRNPRTTTNARRAAGNSDDHSIHDRNSEYKKKKKKKKIHNFGLIRKSGDCKQNWMVRKRILVQTFFEEISPSESENELLKKKLKNQDLSAWSMLPGALVNLSVCSPLIDL